MRQGIRVLGWTVTIVALLVFAFLVMSAYSLFETVVMRQGIRVGQPILNISEERIVLSTPLIINNTSYFEISEFRILTVLKDSMGNNVTDATTTSGGVPRGSLKSLRHNVSISIDDIVYRNLTYLFINDTKFLMDNLLELKYANIIGFKILIPNASLPWGAPFSNLQIGKPSTPQPIQGKPNMVSVDLPVAFQNRSPFTIRGAISLKIYSHDGAFLGSGHETLDVEPNSPYSDDISVELSLESARNYTGRGYLEIRFETVAFSFELPRVTYG